MKPHLFIGSSSESILYAYALQAQLQHRADVQLWNQGFFVLNTSYLDSLVEGLKDADFGVFIFAPDDILTFRDTTLTSARDNVLFEFGLFMGHLGKERVFFVLPKEQGTFRLPSDLLGISTITFDPGLHSEEAAVGSACFTILKAINKLGMRRERRGPPINEAAGGQNTRANVQMKAVEPTAEVKPPSFDQNVDLPALFASLKHSSDYGQRVLGPFQKLTSHITPLSDAAVHLLHRKDRVPAIELFEKVFRKYEDYHSTDFSPLVDMLPDLAAKADRANQHFSSYDLIESFSRLQYALDPCQGAEKRIRERRKAAITVNGGLNDDENRKLCGSILNFSAVCGSAVLSANDYLNQLMTDFLSAAKEHGGE